MPDTREATNTRRGSFASLAPSSLEPRFDPLTSIASQMSPEDMVLAMVGDDDEIEGGGERVAVLKAEQKRQILLVKMEGKLSGQNL